MNLWVILIFMNYIGVIVYFVLYDVILIVIVLALSILCKQLSQCFKPLIKMFHYAMARWLNIWV